MTSARSTSSLWCDFRHGRISCVVHVFILVFTCLFVFVFVREQIKLGYISDFSTDYNTAKCFNTDSNVIVYRLSLHVPYFIVLLKRIHSIQRVCVCLHADLHAILCLLNCVTLLTFTLCLFLLPFRLLDYFFAFDLLQLAFFTCPLHVASSLLASVFFPYFLLAEHFSLSLLT